jgi:outer membrane protein OmpA-like peptidoglycan-associated protein
LGDPRDERVLFLLLALPFAALAAVAAPKSLPSYLTLPPSMHVANQGSLTVEDYGQAEFYTHASDQPMVKQGKHWYAGLVLDNLPPTDDAKAIWAQIKPALLKGGWTVPDEYASSATARYQMDGKDAGASISIFTNTDIRMDLVEVGPPSLVFALTPPTAMPQKISPTKGDFPYLARLPGSKGGAGAQDNGPMMVTLPGSDEQQIVGNGSITKSYGQPAGLSNLLFVTAYHGALVKAPWTIVSESQGVHQADVTLLAHHTKNGRDIWASLHNGGDGYTIQVADAGAARDLSKQLAKDCHVALYGVLFDFNKATLKPESDSVLQTVLALLHKDVTLKLDVQGHTDNVGDDAYNQTLSEARAKSVMAWLTAHGIAGARLSFKGFGKTVPVASNDSDEGRAKNRRVEIAKPGCQGH